MPERRELADAVARIMREELNWPVERDPDGATADALARIGCRVAALRDPGEADAVRGEEAQGAGDGAGSCRSGEVPDGSSSLRDGDLSRGEILAALRPWAQAARGIPDDLPDDLWTTCETWTFALPADAVEALRARGITLLDHDSSVSLWIDGHPLADFRYVAAVYRRLAARVSDEQPKAEDRASGLSAQHASAVGGNAETPSPTPDTPKDRAFSSTEGSGDA